MNVLIHRKETILLLTGLFNLCSLQAQTILSLDSCRAMALRNNKELRMAEEEINAAKNERKAAYTNYLPKLDAMASYTRSEKEISLLSDNQKTMLNNLEALGMSETLSALGKTLVNDLRTDTRNVYIGALILTQPIYMGGKICAYNKIAESAELLAVSNQQTSRNEVIYKVDQTYWQIVALVSRKKLAESFVELVRRLDSDITQMVEEGVATKADELSVRVKVNEAEMALTQVENGLSLSRMQLCQLCGLTITDAIHCLDENADVFADYQDNSNASLQVAWENRPELKSLDLANRIYEQKVRVARSEFLPSVAFVGNYQFTNPSVYNGFENKFKGSWNLSIAVSVPIFHWREGQYKVNVAQAKVRSVQLKLDEAKENIELQVNQSNYKVKEAYKRLSTTQRDCEKADENLRYAQVGFDEGVIPTSNVLEAYTAWLLARSNKINAEIDVRLSKVYLQKALGTIYKSSKK